MSAPRTWKERGEWMDKHGARIHDYSAHPHIRVSYTVNGRLCWRCADWGAGAAVPIDRAMDECEQMEKEAEAEAELKASAETAKRRPVWGAMRYPGPYSRGELLAAINVQADQWRKEASNTGNSHDYGLGYGAALRRCADDLEGK